MHTHFSNHAFDRVQERLTLTNNEVLCLFVNECNVPLGIEKSSNRSHDLFFSITDNACFVAVRDINDGTIVTIVPAEWHNKWSISIEAMTQAKLLAKETMDIKTPIANDEPTKLKVRGHIGYKLTNLGTLDISKYVSAEVAAKDPEAVAKIMKKVFSKNIKINTIDKISINNGGKSEYVDFYLDNIESRFILYK
jgi:hypothetical protein